MDLEELILHYYLRLFSLFIFIFSVLFFLYFFYVLNKTVSSNNRITINKEDSLEKILKKDIKKYSYFETLLIKKYYLINKLIYNKFIHFGDFYIDDNLSIIGILNIITKPSNVLNKITIIEGWSESDLNLELSKYFVDIKNIKYEDIIADTYFFDKNTNFETFVEKLYKFKKNYLNKFQNNELLKIYSKNEIMIIGSLIEKEALDDIDKKNVSSVILNRLNNKMKLQIDATVLYSITNGKYDLKRKLLLKDLKIKHPYNTYINNGLPPKPISYVGKKTIDIIFENYKTDFLFYFFNNSLNRHIFSKSYNEHKIKLDEYRKQK